MDVRDKMEIKTTLNEKKINVPSMPNVVILL